MGHLFIGVTFKDFLRVLKFGGVQFRKLYRTKFHLLSLLSFSLYLTCITLG